MNKTVRPRLSVWEMKTIYRLLDDEVRQERRHLTYERRRAKRGEVNRVYPLEEQEQYYKKLRRLYKKFLRLGFRVEHVPKS